MKVQRSILRIVVIAVSLGLVVLLQATERTPQFHFFFPPCRHVVLISGPRHGSTWFVDSVEGCPSRETAKQSYTELIPASELWTTNQGPVYNITPAAAADYVTNNCSVKIFPTLKQRGEERLNDFLRRIKERNIPVFVLRRRIEDVYGSLAEARENGGWVKNTGGPRQRDVVLDEKYETLRKKLDRFFEQVQGMMWELGIVWDEFQYEDIKDQRRIVGRKHQCVVRNCNFL